MALAMAGKYDEDRELQYCAALLLELPQLVYMSEFRDAWKSSGPLWNDSTKKRSVRSREQRTTSDGGGYGGGASCNDDNVVGGNLAGKKRKANPNPNPSPSSDTTATPTNKKHKPTPLRVKFKFSGCGHTDSDVVGQKDSAFGKKRKNNPNFPGQDTTTTTTTDQILPPPPPPKKRRLKLRFKFSGDGHSTVVAAEKDSTSSSSASGVSGLATNCCYVSSPGKTEPESEREPSSSSSSVVDNDNIISNNLDDDNNTPLQLLSSSGKKYVVPDLNIPIMMTDPDHGPTATAVPCEARTVDDQPAPTIRINNACNIWGIVLDAPSHPPRPNSNSNGYYDRAAVAKERRMTRMMKLKQRKMREI